MILSLEEGDMIFLDDGEDEAQDERSGALTGIDFFPRLASRSFLASAVSV